MIWAALYLLTIVAANWLISVVVLPILRARGYPAALVGQDGLEQLAVPWEAFDAFFIGGSTAWKLGPGARALAAEARRRGKWVHLGRCNSGKRLIYAKRIGCGSADGTHTRYNPAEAIDRMGRWLRRANAPQLPLPLLWEMSA